MQGAAIRRSQAYLSRPAPRPSQWSCLSVDGKHVAPLIGTILSVNVILITSRQNWSGTWLKLNRPATRPEGSGAESSARKLLN